MMTVLICLAVLLLAAGIVIAVLPSASKGIQSISEKWDDSPLVTVRSAGSSDTPITYDPGEERPSGTPDPLVHGSEDLAENEPNILEEFTDPSTPIERKREIAQAFDGLNCRFTINDDIPEETPSDIGPWDDTDGYDEGYEQPVPDEFE